ncbi:unnamed protein product [Spirodela intermedia]|uniref:Uncharacterized protein n=1 Tax=Spirodela intermedia TaxID=51605 RepID=A0A7I8JHV9_SPIIN|nr:unnamed protein product [Spirodela intermedia]CAA6669734.1 unnamed protein product [Spirodela intermedia]
MPACFPSLSAREILTLLPRTGRRRPFSSSFSAAAAAAVGTHLLTLLERCATLQQIKQVQGQMLLTGDIGYGRFVLSSLESPNAFSWNSAIRAHSDCCDVGEAVLLYKMMLMSSARPNNLTYPILLKVCAKTRSLLPGGQIFGHALQLGMDSDAFVSNSAIHMFGNCGISVAARQIFDTMCDRDLVSWNSMINGYLRSGRPAEALELVRDMETEVEPDEVTMMGAVLCCAMLGDLDLARKYHSFITEKDLDRTVPLSNALMDMYVKCGSLEDAERLFLCAEGRRTVVTWTTMMAGYLKLGSSELARNLFEEMPTRDVVSWNVMIGGYVQLGRAKDALSLFHEMQRLRVDPMRSPWSTFCRLAHSSEPTAWEYGRIASWGSIISARSVFSEMPERNALTWTAMISGLAIHGLGQDAISHFSKMTAGGLTPDGVTFLGLLSACSHAGLVDDGRHYFDQMRLKYNLLPGLKHYSCMSGRLTVTKSGCKRWRHLRAAGQHVRGASLWSEADKVRALMKRRGLEKTPGCSSIEVNGVVHEFTARDQPIHSGERSTLARGNYSGTSNMCADFSGR